MKLALAGETMRGRGVAERLAAVPPESLCAPEAAAVDEADLCILNLECCTLRARRAGERGARARWDAAPWIAGQKRHRPKLSETERRLYVQAR